MQKKPTFVKYQKFLPLAKGTLFWMVLLLLTAGQALAQVPITSNLRKKIITAHADSLQLDSLSIVPNTVQITNIAATAYRVDFVKGILYWLDKPAKDSVAIAYRVFPYKLYTPLQRRRYDSLILYSAPIFPPEKTRENRDLLNFGNINAQGSFGRQIGFGNNQSAVLNSNMNIQLSGMLADSIELQAAITDNNVPIQPDGNTQQLNEFDEVYIRFRKKNWQLNIGDMDIRENASYFLNFYKRLQGMSFGTTYKLTKNIEANTFVSGSVAKGKFTRNIITGLEGNQGPYRLTGANGELFFIVLANTERVYIDGELLQRGEDQDYVINYNTAEISFMPRRMITKDSRIQIEFEYADRNFLNTNIFAKQDLNLSEKLKLRIGFFNNADAKNSSINQVLDNKQKQFLSQLGDSIQYAYYPSAIVDTLSAGKILYEKKYVPNHAVIDSFYQYSVDPTATLYNVSFTNVGMGNGNYIQDANAANGKVYKYLAPVNGIKQGSYEPVMALITPKKQQIINVGLDYTITKNTLLRAEVATSNIDVNTFSFMNNGDDRGYAAKIGIGNVRLLSAKHQLQLVSDIDYELVQQKFKPLERLRNIEFTRDWGLSINAPPATENMIRASVGIKNDLGNRLTYKFINYHISDDYNGMQHALLQFTRWQNFIFNNDFTITSYKSATDKGYFLRPVVDVTKKFERLRNWQLGFRYALEHNESRYQPTDTLNKSSFSFDSYSVFLKSDPAKKNKYGLTFFTRSDLYPVYKNFVRGDRSYNLNLQTELLSNSKRQFYLNTTFRKLKVYDPTVSRQQEDNSLLGRAEYMMNEWNGFVNGNVLYEVGAGQEQKRAYAYLEVPPGTGQYTWRDYNNDGIQQLNEFELALFQDEAKFLRIFTPTNEYIKANYTTFNYSISISPKALWKNGTITKAKKFLSRINFTSSLQTSKKIRAKGLFEFNPFTYHLNDTSLITSQNIFVNTFSFNRQSSIWGFDMTNTRNQNKALLNYGYESRKNNEWIFKWRNAISKSINFNFNTIIGSNALYTDNNQFQNRNYEIKKYVIEPNFTYIRGTTFRLITGYRLENKTNALKYGGEKSIAHVLTAETKYNILQNSAVTAKFTFDNLSYTANNPNTTVSYIMLDGLQPGKNYLWNITLTKRLLNNLELNLQYDGRKPANTKIIHNGRASITAIF